MNGNHRNKPKGVTLVELLVVVTILMLLAAFAIPAIRPLSEGRRIREAARAVDVFLTQLKIRSVEIQRPVGVLLERMTQEDASGTVVYQDDACNVLQAVEIPPPYAGDFANSRIRVQDWTTIQGGGTHYVLKLLVMSGDFSGRLLRQGDQVQLNHQGPRYDIIFGYPNDFPVDPEGYIDFTDPAVTDSNNDTWIDSHVLTVTRPADSLAPIPPLPWPVTASGTLNTTTFYSGGTILWSADIPFQFYRQPQPAPVEPVRLPKGTVIDLADSGYFDATHPDAFSGGGLYPDAFGLVDTVTHRGPMLLFAPNGAIQSVYHWGWDTTGTIYYGPHRITKPVFLMIGKWERTGAQTVTAGSPVLSLADDGLHNWQDASNLWIAVGPQNGMVTSADVNAPATTPAGLSVPGDTTEADPAALALQMQVSRALAREAQNSKGALQE